MIQTIQLSDMPFQLQQIASPPATLYVRASSEETFNNLMCRPRVAIVGTRRVSPYGHTITAKLARELAAYGVVIVSGLAFGVDAIAHRAALEANGLTLAVLPSPVEHVHPRSHEQLAQQILDTGGALVSEYPEGTISFKQNFVARNRIVTGLADILLITEAADRSGTLHTARFALDQGKEVLAVPGNVTSPMSEGTNNLIKSGATPVTDARDVLHALHLKVGKIAPSKKLRTVGANPDEQHILNLLEQGISDGNELLANSGMAVELFNHHLTMLEITAKIRPLGANHWALR